MGIVSLQSCKTYDYELVRTAIQKNISNLGGLEKYLEKGDRVLLKVNLLMKKKPEEATTTHPVFVKALADILAEYGCSVLIGDSPGGPYNYKSLIGIYEACGYNDLVNDNIKLNWNFEEREHLFENGEILKRVNLVSMLDDVDKVISVSKFKTHGMMLFTGAVKNLFGVIPGLSKAEYHFKMPRTEDFANALVDICEGVRPVLSFMDGIVGMEGAGPSAGNPVEIGAVIAAENPHQLDFIAVQLANIPSKEVPTLKKAMDRGLIDEAAHSIELKGVPISQLRLENFEAPNIRSVVFWENYPKWFRNLADRALKPKPIFNESKCVGCGECARLCPPQTIEMLGGFPKVDLERCIRCYCCQELCPKKAVEINRPLLLKLMSKL